LPPSRSKPSERIWFSKTPLTVFSSRGAAQRPSRPLSGPPSMHGLGARPFGPFALRPLCPDLYFQKRKAPPRPFPSISFPGAKVFLNPKVNSKTHQKDPVFPVPLFRAARDASFGHAAGHLQFMEAFLQARNSICLLRKAPEGRATGFFRPFFPSLAGFFRPFFPSLEVYFRPFFS
jgi:hypothetical protein